MAKRKFKFDFEKESTELLKIAEENGIDDATFKSVYQEFVRMKGICDTLYEKVKDNVDIETEGSMGQPVYKANPLLKEYQNAHKLLVTDAIQLRKMLEGTEKQSNDWL